MIPSEKVHRHDDFGVRACGLRAPRQRVGFSLRCGQRLSSNGIDTMATMRRAITMGLLCAATAVTLAAQSSSSETIPAVLVSRQLLEAQGLSVGETISLSTEASGAHPRRFRV